MEFGYLMINKRDVAKTAMQAGTATDSPATWTSRYGSVTSNQYGREFPMGGMNEAGLAVEIHTNDSDETIRFRAAYPESTRCSN